MKIIKKVLPEQLINLIPQIVSKLFQQQHLFCRNKIACTDSIDI